MLALAWLRCTTCVGHLGWLFKLNLHPRHQHCTDEAQKAETVLSAVIYIYIYIYIENRWRAESNIYSIVKKPPQNKRLEIVHLAGLHA